ncbi:cell division site-positioning protein MapZ family protein [Lactococcus cremoris]|uniref:cell division site-positioning protein MapZ family protein n=1 Tax=Lactococcus lactis subsp. cremoris TaxID=1359 RepID=UPI0025A1C0E1|nr:cell division site-positioning protein MapZ family protein [Lactococcus cremoris]MDM7654099.1 cell division site-positioning protein MapZ family protein [Lactococcus cremoris]
MSNKNKKNKNKNKNNNTNKNKNNQKSEQQIGEKTLKLQDLQNFTVGEIVEESKRVDKENEENESVLDKYIRQHRGEIEDAKNKNLDEFIQSEREHIEPSADKAEVQEKVLEQEAEDASKDKAVIEKNTDSESTSAVENKSETDEVKIESKSNLPEEKATEKVTDKKSEEAKAGKNDLVLDPVVMVDAPVSTLPEQKESPSVEKIEEIDEPVEELPLEEEKVTVPIMMSANEVPMEEVKDDESPETSKVEKSEAEPKEPEEEKNSDLNEEAKETPEASKIEEAPTDLVQEPKENTADIPDKVITADKVAPVLTSEKIAPKSESQEEPQESAEEKPTDGKAKNRKTPIIIGLCAIVLIAAGAVGFAQYNNHQKPKTVQTTKSSQTDLDKFEKQYDSFFTDKSHNVLKNSQFENLAALETLVNSHKNSMAWSNAVSETESLTDQINAIKKVNALFTSAAITDGKLDSAAKIVTNVKIPETPKTSNETLNKLLTQAIDLAKSQVAKESSAQASASSAEAKANQGAGTQTSSSSTTSQSSSTTNASSSTNSNANASTNGNGLSSNGVNLEVSAARVQPQAGINPNDPAFTWGSGIKEMVLNKARERGYITGDNYILVPTAIHTTNGSQDFPAGIVSGYYNLYAPDGRYLVSINAKTGFFVGNGSGHADNLDYSE